MGGIDKGARQSFIGIGGLQDAHGAVGHALGEIAVGLGLLVGALTGIAAFFGATMNMSYMLAGSTSVNPVMFAFTIGIILAWKVAGWYGLDRYLLPLLGVPWHRRAVVPAAEPAAPPASAGTA